MRFTDDDPSCLSAEQASVLACLRAGLDAPDIEASTGLGLERVAAVVQDLIALELVRPSRGALEPAPPAPDAYPSPRADVEGVLSDPALPEGIEPWTGDVMPEGSVSSHDLLAPAEVEQDPASASGLPEPDAESRAFDEVNYRKLFEARFSELELGQRVAAAEQASGAELYALCFDPAPRVIAALLANMHFGLAHARLAALHHKTPQGLEILARRADVVRDQHVQRRLMQNLQTPESVLERVLRVKRLLDIYRMSVDRDLPERNRLRVRSGLRACFNHAEPDERAALIIKTEGRCLLGLSGCTFDGRTTQVLCNLTSFSTLFIQNLARFPATPPLLINKLLRLPVVQRQPQLRTLLLRHPGASSELKRRG